MNNQSSNKWRLGLFAVVAMALLLGGLYYVGKQRNLFGSVFQLRSIFNNVSGLKTGSNVRFGGIIVGTVDDIQLLSDSSVLVVMLLQKEVKKFIKKDARVSIGSEGLMGDRVVIITPVNSTPKEVETGDTLVSSAPVEMDAILASLKTSAENAADITGQLAELAYRLNHGNGALSKLIGDTVFARNISATMVNLKKSSEGLNENMEAAKHNFLLRGYFKKKQKQEDKKLKEEEKTEKQQHR
jgi:phospholipid/cholesterol/gamma-HCH transport system substrate-binding protein